MIALAAILAGVLAGLVGLVAWLVVSLVGAKDKLGDARRAQALTDGELERSQFELEVERKAHAAVTKRAATLEEYIRDDLDTAPNRDLDVADVRGRVLRITQAWAAADQDRVPTEPTAPVPDASAAAAAGPVVSTADPRVRAGG